MIGYAMARLDRNKGSQMAANPHISAASLHQQPPPSSTSKPAKKTTPMVKSTNPSAVLDPDVIQSHENNIRSYDAFKRLIEGHTYHPKDYRNSAPKTGQTNMMMSAVGSHGDEANKHHDRPEQTSPNKRVHSPGRSSTHSLEELEAAKRNSAHNRLGFENETDSNVNQRGYARHEQRMYLNEPIVDLTVKQAKNQSIGVDQKHQLGQPYAAQKLLHQPLVHSGLHTNSSHATRNQQPDNVSQNINRKFNPRKGQSQLADNVPDTTHQYRRRFKDELAVHRPRPKTEYIDRSEVYRDQVTCRNSGQQHQRRGHVNSAYISDNHPQQITVIPETVSHSRPETKPGQLYDTRQRTVDHQNAVAMSRTGPYHDTKIHLSQTNVTAHPERYTNLPNGGSVMSTRHQAPQLQHGDYLTNADCITEVSESKDKYCRLNHIQSHSKHETSQARVQQTPLKSQNGSVYKPETDIRKPLRLSISAERKRQNLFTCDTRIPAQPKEVGLQKFSRDASGSKGGAIMIKMASSASGDSQQQQQQTGGMSPVIIQVGAKTLGRIKHQMGKKNKYVVQQTTHVKPASKPKTHFTLSLFTMCFCLSPLGFIAMIFAVCSASAYKEGDPESGRCWSKTSMGFSIAGILGTIATTVILLATNTIPILGRYGED